MKITQPSQSVVVSSSDEVGQTDCEGLINHQKIKVNQGGSSSIKVNQGILKHFYFMQNQAWSNRASQDQSKLVKRRRAKGSRFKVASQAQN